MECAKSPNGHHCWHPIRKHRLSLEEDIAGDFERCCFCGQERPCEKVYHGTYQPQELVPMDYYDMAARYGWDTYDVT